MNSDDLLNDFVSFDNKENLFDNNNNKENF